LSTFRKRLAMKLEILPAKVAIERLTPLVHQASEEKKRLLPCPEDVQGDPNNWFHRGYHNLVSTTFPLSRECHVCKQAFWGTGLSCQVCRSFCCHKKCELKSPFSCHNLVSASTNTGPKNQSFKLQFWKRTSTDLSDAIRELVNPLENLLERKDLSLASI
jgi:hypothetical protein